MMSRFLALIALLWLFPAQISAQVSAPTYAPLFNPAADYVTPGQDEPGYRAWYAAAAWRPVYVRAFNQYLITYGVGGVAPTWQLLRTASDCLTGTRTNGSSCVLSTSDDERPTPEPEPEPEKTPAQ